MTRVASALEEHWNFAAAAANGAAGPCQPSYLEYVLVCNGACQAKHKL